jgi:hypothetical protein
LRRRFFLRSEQTSHKFLRWIHVLVQLLRSVVKRRPPAPADQVEGIGEDEMTTESVLIEEPKKVKLHGG